MAIANSHIKHKNDYVEPMDVEMSPEEEMIVEVSAQDSEPGPSQKSWTSIEARFSSQKIQEMVEWSERLGESSTLKKFRLTRSEFQAIKRYHLNGPGEQYKYQLIKNYVWDQFVNVRCNCFSNLFVSMFADI